MILNINKKYTGSKDINIKLLDKEKLSNIPSYNPKNSNLVTVGDFFDKKNFKGVIKTLTPKQYKQLYQDMKFPRSDLAMQVDFKKRNKK